MRLFPDSGGFRFFLIDSDQVTTVEQAAALAGIVEKELQPFGVDAVSTTERLEAFHRSRTPTCRRSRRSAASGCCSARSAWRR